MIQELLLGLSGLSTPLFDPSLSDELLLTPAESALLASASRLASLHRALKSHLERIVAHHPSSICRAVATAITSTHLAKFRKTIVNVERDILLKDVSAVGAYDIVPLASVVGLFDPWRRKLEWYWEIACFIYPTGTELLSVESRANDETSSSGVQLLDKLRKETQTGFSDIGEAALELTAIAERVWIRQLSQWIVNGSLSGAESQDFFVRVHNTLKGKNIEYEIVETLLPAFVTFETAQSILFIGTTIRLLTIPKATEIPHRISPAHPRALSSTTTARLQVIANSPSPLSPSAVSAIILEMRVSLAKQVVERILPVHSFIRVLGLIRQFLLSGRGDFIDALIAEADDFIASRHQQMHTASSGIGLAGIMIKESEARTVLARTWTALAPLIGKDARNDDSLEWAREHVVLTLSKAHWSNAKRGRKQVPRALDRFNDMLLLTPSVLAVQVDSSFEVFLGSDQMEIYSAISSYLVAIRRGHNHLSDMWRLSTLRRHHPAPARPRRTKTGVSSHGVKLTREKLSRRMLAMRECWNASTSAVCLLAELGSFLSSEIISKSWDSFQAWATASSSSSSSDSHVLPHDPEVIAVAHQQFQNTLLHMLLLMDETYMKLMHSLLGAIEHLVATVHAVQSLQKSVDLQDEGVFEGNGRDYAQEEKKSLVELHAATQAVANGIQRVIESLRTCSEKLKPQTRMIVDSATTFRPYQDTAGINRLLIKLDRGLLSTDG